MPLLSLQISHILILYRNEMVFWFLRIRLSHLEEVIGLELIPQIESIALTWKAGISLLSQVIET